MTVANLCTTCGEDFGSVSAFEAHRIGDYLQRGASEYTGRLAEWTSKKGRRCLTPAELLERRWTRDSRGRWRQPNQGAPWAPSQDQAVTERRRHGRGRGQTRPRPRGAPARLPDSRKESARE